MSTPPDELERTIGVLDPTTPAEVRAERRAELAHGARVGRYMVIKMLGRGGMGVVYAAHDTQLDRQVALKLLHTAQGGERLAREAQALARLSDPHVVQVFDAGEVDGRVFLAMQLVDGEDLATAIRRRPSAPQLLAWFVQAGRGLASAHAVGLVHRDFKPSNVLIDRQGNVAVTDFGLARSATFDGDVTGMGVIMGTPAYMAPEQHGMQPATPASDQFSFCVSLWEALFGSHPFIAGDRGAMSPFAIGYAIYDGELLAPPRGARVPRRVIDALVRGLQRAPAERWPSMTELLAELAPVRKRRAWPAIVVACAVAAAVTGVAVYVLAARDRDDATPRCEREAAARLARAWSAPAAQQLHDRLVATGKSYADAAARSAQAGLDRYATRWTELAGDVCTAERAAGGAVTETIARKRSCLDARLDALRGIGALLGEPRAGDFVDRAPSMVDALPDLGDCADIDALREAPSPPTTLIGDVTRLESDIARATAVGIGGDFKRAVADLTAIVTRVDALGWGPTRAHAHFALGRAQLALLEPARAELVAAAALATEFHLDRDAARAWALATQAAGVEHSKDGVTALSTIARATAARSHDRALAVEVQVRTARALVRLREWQDGAAACRAAHAAALAIDNAGQLDAARDCLIEALTPLGAYGELEPLVASAIADKSKSLGADHPTVADYVAIQVGISL